MTLLVDNVNMTRFTIFCFLFLNCFTLPLVYGRIHNLKLQNDNRHRMTLSTFGFLKKGTLAVNISMFTFQATKAKDINNKIFGFTLDKSNSPGFSNYVESMAECIWNKPEDTLVSTFFKFDLDKQQINIERKGKALDHLKVVAVPREQYLFNEDLEHGVNLVAIAKDEAATPKPSATVEKKEEIKPPTKVEGKDTEKSDTKSTTEEKAEKKTDKKSEVKKEMKTGTSSRKRREAGEGNLKPKDDGDKSAAKSTDDKGTAKTVDGKGAVKTADDKGPAKTADDKGTAKSAEDKGASKAATNNDKSSPDKSPLPDKPLEVKDDKSKDLVTSVPMTLSVQDSIHVYQSYFLVHIQTDEEEGLYNLFFHNCLHIDSLINLTLEIIEDNNGNYLSADEMPIPMLYFVFSVVFLVVTFMWLSVLRKAEEGVYKLHYMMLVVVFVKSVSCLFHGINMYMIQKNGIHVDAWAILWYIVYLTRGALMFVTVLLIGAGWAFIKHVFSDREKKLFLIVMPLQILANVAWVIVEESEEGTSSYTLWNRIFMVVDLLCCFAILFPVIWSIRHLQEASRTDGKAAINLNKLKLFKHFYILVVCYIYFTRIIVYLLKITLPFHYGWMRNLFAEIFLLGFFTLTGYKFRPTMDNPYLQVPLDSDDEDIEMEEVLTKTGNMENLTRVNLGRVDEAATTTVKQRESSHEFD